MYMSVFFLNTLYSAAIAVWRSSGVAVISLSDFAIKTAAMTQIGYDFQQRSALDGIGE